MVYYILGLGRTGIATANFLKARGASMAAWDDDLIQRQQFQKAAPDVVVENLNNRTFHSEDVLILSPGIPHALPVPHPVAVNAMAAGASIIVDVELFFQERQNALILGITGTNGKSTTTALVHHILEQAGHQSAQGGNIGVSVLALPAKNVYAIELSSYQLERITTPALAGALLLNLTPDHLERHGSLEGYREAKKRIYDLLKPHGFFVIGLDGYSASVYEEHNRRHVGFSVERVLDHGVYVQDGILMNALSETPYAVMDLNQLVYLKGKHNLQNIAGAYALLKVTVGLSDADFQAGLLTFRGLEHRQERVLEAGLLTFINDSKATNMDSVVPALKAFDGIYWLAGGMAKETVPPREILAPYLSKIKHVYGFGRDGHLFVEAVQGKVPTTLVKTMEEALSCAMVDAEASQKPSVILLSPGGASLDQFKDYEDRGRQFKTLVLKDRNHGG